MACAQCQAPLPAQPYLVDGRLYCNTRCAHAAGDRTVCRDGCGCTAYARKRRRLREHRAQMRVMDDLIAEAGLERELEERLIEETGNTGFWMGQDSELDEGSDREDPERQLLDERGARLQLLQAVQGALECQTLRRDLDRARGCSWRTGMCGDGPRSDQRPFRNHARSPPEAPPLCAQGGMLQRGVPFANLSPA
jgi:hypothetical protein